MMIVPFCELPGGTGVTIHRQQASPGQRRESSATILYPSQALLAAAIVDLPRGGGALGAVRQSVAVSPATFET